MENRQYDIRTNCTYLPPRAGQLPLPGLYPLLKDGATRAWTTGYPAWCLQYYTCLCSLRRDRDNVIVETGTNNGLSTALFAAALVETGLPGRVHTFEKNPKRCQQARGIWADLKVAKYIELYEGDSLERLPEFIEKHDEVHFAFIDSSHATQQCLDETKLLLDLVIAGEGKFLFDNTECGPVDAAICQLKEDFSEHGGWVDFPNCSGCPNGQVLWQPWSHTEPKVYFNSRECL